MNRPARVLAALIALAGVPAAAKPQARPATPGADTSLKSGAQRQYVVKTVPLHHLSSEVAVKLLAPYTKLGGVYEVPGVSAVTIREVPEIYNEMMAVLAKYDREPATVLLNFQLVSATETGTRDPAAAGIDSLLRGVLKYSGYRLLGTAVATTGEDRRVTQTIAGDNETLTLTVFVDDVRIDGNDASVNLHVSLSRPPVMAASNASGSIAGRGPVELLSTGVTVPIGQTVLLGTSASDSGQRALILTVRPQLAKRKTTVNPF